MYQRILLIKTPNQFRGTKKDNKYLFEELMSNQENIEWLLYNAVLKYAEIAEKGNFQVLEDFEEVERKHNLESFPHQVAAEELFTWDLYGEIHQNLAHQRIIEHLTKLKKQGLINSKIDMKPKTF